MLQYCAAVAPSKHRRNSFIQRNKNMPVKIFARFTMRRNGKARAEVGKAEPLIVAMLVGNGNSRLSADNRSKARQKIHGVAHGIEILCHKGQHPEFFGVQTCFLFQFAECCILGRFALFDTTGYGLPDIGEYRFRCRTAQGVQLNALQCTGPVGGGGSCHIGERWWVLLLRVRQKVTNRILAGCGSFGVLRWLRWLSAGFAGRGSDDLD